MDLLELQSCINNIDLVKISDLNRIVLSHKSILILGNGGSNSVASHISQDYSKKLGIKSLSFSDPSRLTCYINDYGMEWAYIKFVEDFYVDETLVILISSSGNSKNITNLADYCVANSIDFITLSGFSKENNLNSYSDKAVLSFWVDSCDYGVVEITHESILHSIV
jgi:D-sedoheptulose 7-phosphate isomerase